MFEFGFCANWTRHKIAKATPMFSFPFFFLLVCLCASPADPTSSVCLHFDVRCLFLLQCRSTEKKNGKRKSPQYPKSRGQTCKKLAKKIIAKKTHWIESQRAKNEKLWRGPMRLVSSFQSPDRVIAFASNQLINKRSICERHSIMLNKFPREGGRYSNWSAIKSYELNATRTGFFQTFFFIFIYFCFLFFCFFFPDCPWRRLRMPSSRWWSWWWCGCFCCRFGGNLFIISILLDCLSVDKVWGIAPSLSPSRPSSLSSPSSSLCVCVKDL